MKTINESKKSIKESYKFFATSIIIAILINIISNAILLDQQEKTKKIIIFTSILIVLLIFLLYLISLFKSKNFYYKFKGMFSLNRETNKSISIRYYDFSENITRILDSVFNENPALLKIWNDNPLYKYEKSKNESIKLLKEATEYFVLQKLSTNLCDYFNGKKLKLTTLYRNDVSNIIVTNRVLDLVSREMCERTAFDDYTDKPSEYIVYSMGKNNIFYERFDLTLPQGSKIKRNENNEIEIETKRFKFQIEVIISGANTFVDSTFDRFFKNDPLNPDFVIYINFKVKFKPFTFILPFGTEYYAWLEHFIKSMKKSFSIENYLNTINWNGNKILIDFLLNKKT